ncbi:hypothetical protein DSCO28_42130 [Desulfosarcina ovata subsp. sediminis]|uniref:Putative metallopeptidase domain-containing protein n=1 Tax=Desulfosarcina ovata subsp. sediminis TaxID=885957 RepID=A0A5K7ZTV4_9BACT|nr:hypothetical protein [Desulfosarcina ovata]BBO83647.1 hypothetical protein DSCO28_42130 [Desulfosarcina ovata subsp. sediminis]
MNSRTTAIADLELIASAVGEGAAAEFCGFLRIFRDLPDPQVLINSPETADVPDDPATLYAVCELLSQKADDIYAHLEAERFRERSDNQDRRVEKQAMEAGEEVDLPDVESRGKRRQRIGESGDHEDDSGEAEAIDQDGPDEDQGDPGQGDPGRSGEVRDAPPAEDGAGGIGEDTTGESQWRINLAQAASRARSMGDLPAGLARMIERLLSPKLDWRQLLNRFIQASARSDYAWMPPNRRYLHRNLYLPAMRSTDLPEVVVAVDTSGSVSSTELNQFAALPGAGRRRRNRFPAGLRLGGRPGPCPSLHDLPDRSGL